MLSQKHRFHRRNSVKAVLHKGKHKSVGHFKVSVLPPRKNDNTSSVAVVVSKKVAKTAVDRNRIRRRVFESVRNNWEFVEASAPVQIVVMCFNQELKDMPIERLESDLRAALKHALERL